MTPDYLEFVVVSIVQVHEINDTKTKNNNNNNSEKIITKMTKKN